VPGRPQLIGLLVPIAEATLAAIADLGLRSSDAARTAPRAAACLSPAMAGQFQELKDFLNRTLYHHYRVRRMEVKAERVLGELFAAYLEDPELLPPELARTSTAPRRSGSSATTWPA
jgi:dGTPase